LPGTYGKRNAFRILIKNLSHGKDYFGDLFANETAILNWMIKK
jgi:hypothetical protein